jgi:hypothetical protein
LRLDVRPQRTQQLAARPQRAAEPRHIKAMQQIGIVVGGTTEHRTVGMREMRGRLLQRGDAAVDDHRQLRAFALERIRPFVAQRRHLAVLLWRQALEPGIARVHDEHSAAGLRDRVDEGAEDFIVFVVVDSEPTLHRDRHRFLKRRNGIDHRRHAVGDQPRLTHQARTEAPGLDTVGGTADVEVDLVEAGFRTDPRGLRQQRRLAAAKLQRHRVLDRIQRQQPRTIAEDHGIGMHHLGIQPCMRRKQTVEHAAMRVGPVHHRGYGQAQRCAVRRRGRQQRLAGGGHSNGRWTRRTDCHSRRSRAAGRIRRPKVNPTSMSAPSMAW